MRIGFIMDYGIIKIFTGFDTVVWNRKPHLHFSDNRKEYLVLILSRALVTKDGVRFGIWIY
jgi:hypothetical protein